MHMVPVKTTAALLVASMSLFSVAQAAPAVKRDFRNGSGGQTPITGSSSEGSGPSTSPSSGGTGGGSSTGNGGGNTGSSNIPGNGGSVGSGGNSGSTGTSASPISSGNRPDSSGSTGNNAPRPGPRAPVDQPNAGGLGPFGEAPAPRTMDGTEGQGFNFGNILSGINSLTSTIFQLVATFGMLKQLFGMFGGDKDKAAGAGGALKEGASAVTEVAAVADRGVNVARDAETTLDAAIEAERARREGRGLFGGADADDAEGAGLAERD